MIYNELPHLAHKCDFNMQTNRDRHRVYQLVELVIRDIAEQLKDEDRKVVLKRFNIYDRE